MMICSEAGSNRRFTYLLLAAVLIFSLLVPAFVLAADFVVRNIGDYGNVTVMQVSGNYDAKNPDGMLRGMISA